MSSLDHPFVIDVAVYPASVVLTVRGVQFSLLGYARVRGPPHRGGPSSRRCAGPRGAPGPSQVAEGLGGAARHKSPQRFEAPQRRCMSGGRSPRLPLAAGAGAPGRLVGRPAPARRADRSRGAQQTLVGSRICRVPPRSGVPVAKPSAGGGATPDSRRAAGPSSRGERRCGWRPATP